MTLFTAQMLLTLPSIRPSEQDRLGYLPGSLYGDDIFPETNPIR